MAQNYEMRVKLSNFIDSRIIEQEDDNGVREKGIFIPIDKNALYVNDHNCVFFSAFVTEKMSNTGDNASHYLKQKTNKQHVAMLDSLGYKTPNLGSMWEKNYQPRFQDKSHKDYRGNAKVKIVRNNDSDE